MELFSNSQTEWLEKGGSADALKFIDTVVGTLHTKAVKEGIVYKQVDETVQTEEVAESETPTETVVAEAVDEVVAETTETVKSVNFAEVLSELMFATLKQYHETSVAPLIAELKSLRETSEKVQKDAQPTTIFGWDMSGLLPPAAIASRIQKEFGTAPAAEVKGEEVKGHALTKKEVSPAVAMDGNLLGNFLA